MAKRREETHVIAEMQLEGCPEGPVLQPLEEKDEIAQRYFAGWETPLAPWGGFRLASGLAVVKDGERTVLEWTMAEGERAIVTGSLDERDYSVVAVVRPIDVKAGPHVDRNDCAEAMVGIVFRVMTSRNYYQFGIEGRHRVVLYRRIDDEWCALAQQEVDVPENYVTLEVHLDGDGIRCCAKELDVTFFNTDTMLPAGKTGVRAIGRTHLSSLKVTVTPSQKKRTAYRRRLREAEEEALAEAIPECVRLI